MVFQDVESDIVNGISHDGCDERRELLNVLSVIATNWLRIQSKLLRSRFTLFRPLYMVTAPSATAGHPTGDDARPASIRIAPIMVTETSTVNGARNRLVSSIISDKEIVPERSHDVERLKIVLLRLLQLIAAYWPTKYVTFMLLLANINAKLSVACIV